MRPVRIIYSKVAEKFFVRHEDIREEFIDSISKLINDDHREQVNFKNLKGKLKGYSRIAIDGYRVIFRMEDGEIIIVSVVMAGSRGDIYKHLR
ncbi:MAG: type II toxin-antitoxin system RelE/ParE family toxin [Synergistaceae bacterium]|nr:type II toxin-antitoxin system RelE/ParE family toxin [Synergistaceae bacterium]